MNVLEAALLTLSNPVYIADAYGWLFVFGVYACVLGLVLGLAYIAVRVKP